MSGDIIRTHTRKVRQQKNDGLPETNNNNKTFPLPNKTLCLGLLNCPPSHATVSSLPALFFSPEIPLAVPVTTSSKFLYNDWFCFSPLLPMSLNLPNPLGLCAPINIILVPSLLVSVCNMSTSTDDLLKQMLLNLCPQNVWNAK